MDEAFYVQKSYIECQDFSDQDACPVPENCLRLGFSHL